MADREVRVVFRTIADPKGAQQTKRELEQVKRGANQAQEALGGNPGEAFARSIGAAREQLERARQQVDRLRAAGKDVKIAEQGLDALEQDLNRLDPRFEDFEQDLLQIGQALKGLKIGDVGSQSFTRAEKDLADLLRQFRETKQQTDQGLRIRTGEEEVRRLKDRLSKLQAELVRTERGTRAFRRLNSEIRATERELGKAERRKLKIDEDARRADNTLARTRARLTQVNAELEKVQIGSRRFRALQREARNLNRTLSRTQRATGALGDAVAFLPGRFGGIASAFAGSGKQAGLLLGAVTLLAGGFTALGSSIDRAANAQNLEVSLSTLLGGIQEAKDRLEELKGFAASTPFELPEIARASKVLETLTKGALATGEGLRTVGDLAASTGEPFSSLALHVGRVYDALQNGRPIGESLLRLQELGVISAGTRAEIELLQKEGRKGEEVWGVAARAFERFAGEMERRSKTLSGAFSTLRDGINQALSSSVGRPLADALARGINNVNQALGFTVGSAEEAGNSLDNNLAKPLPKIEELVRKARELGPAFEGSFEQASGQVQRLVQEMDEALARSREFVQQQNNLTDANLALELARIDQSDASEEDKELARIEAREAARVEKHQRAQALIRQEIANTQKEYEALQESREAAVQELAGLQVGNVQDVNIIKLSEALDAANESLLLSSRRAAAFAGELAALQKDADEFNFFTPDFTRARNADAQVDIQSQQREAQRSQAQAQEAIESIRRQADSVGLSLDNLGEEAAQEAAARIEEFSRNQLAQEQIIQEFSDRLAEINNEGGADRLQQQLKIAALVFQRQGATNELQALGRLGDIRQQEANQGSDVIKEFERAQKDARRTLQIGLKQLQDLADEAEQENFGREIAAALERLAFDDTTGIDSLVERVKDSRNEQARQLAARLQEALATAEAAPPDAPQASLGDLEQRLQRVFGGLQLPAPATQTVERLPQSIEDPEEATQRVRIDLVNGITDLLVGSDLAEALKRQIVAALDSFQREPGAESTQGLRENLTRAAGEGANVNELLQRIRDLQQREATPQPASQEPLARDDRVTPLLARASQQQGESNQQLVGGLEQLVLMQQRSQEQIGNAVANGLDATRRATEQQLSNLSRRLETIAAQIANGR